jgi:hypothetical protein
MVRSIERRIAHRLVPSRVRIRRISVRPHGLLVWRPGKWTLWLVIATLVALSGNTAPLSAQVRRPLVDVSCNSEKIAKLEQLADGPIGETAVHLDCTKLDVSPERLFSPLLDYPEAARREGFEADVVVQGILEVDGFVRIAGVVDAGVRQDARVRRELEKRWREGQAMPLPLLPRQAQRLFEESALTLLVSSQFRPAVLAGEPVRVLICLPVSFTLIG